MIGISKIIVAFLLIIGILIVAKVGRRIYLQVRDVIMEAFGKLHPRSGKHEDLQLCKLCKIYIPASFRGACKRKECPFA